jgi:hypothetical protein
MKNHCRVLQDPSVRITKLVLLILTMACIGRTNDANAQINSYARVTAISGTLLTLSNINQTYHSFAAGEQVLVIQMKDAVIGTNTSNNSSFGTISAIASAGFFEMATINTISGTAMTLNASLTKTYNTAANGRVQVVSFNLLGAGNYTLTSAVTAIPWDGNVGGVLAFQVGGTLTLSNSISADGLGFRGGSGSANYEVNCEPTVYDNTSSNYAYKGEGIEGSSTITYTTHTGRGPLVSGGGGGSDDNGGGGGGSNYTAGGAGGPGYTCTAATASGGLGGVTLGTYVSGGRVFMGGGGGGGQQNNGVGSAGMTGGGIVFIRAHTLTSSCTGSVSISASGLTATNSGNDGAGGAGAGGSIVLSVDIFSIPSSCPLHITSNGGNGGTVTDPTSHGGGGGGGQGAVVFSSSLPTVNITAVANNGTGGANGSGGGAGSAGNGGGTNNNGIMSSVPIVLPVSVLSFGVVKSGQEDLISWTSSQLYQHMQFSVERSADGLSFQRIGVVDGIVDGGNTGNYVFADAAPLPGKNFYRVRTVDVSGNEKYTETDLIDWTNATAAFRISPNPTQGRFTISLMNILTGPVSLVLEDLSGAAVYRSSAMANAGKVEVSVGKSLPAGIYLIHVGTRTGSETGKLLFRP